MNQIGSNLYERKGQALTNFKFTLPTIEEIEEELNSK